MLHLHLMIVAILVLLVSGWMTTIGVNMVLTVFVRCWCFWGKVIWRTDEIKRVEYDFNFGWGPLMVIVGAVGLLWSILVLSRPLCS